MHTLTPTRPCVVANSAKAAIRHELTRSEELADAEAQLVAADNERWLASQAKAVPRKTADPDERRRLKAQLISQACGVDSHDGPLHPAKDVEEWLRLHEQHDGCAEPSVGPKLLVRLSRIDTVPNHRLRARYLELKAEHKCADPEEGVPSPSDVASRLDMRNSEFERVLGVLPTTFEEGTGSLRLFLPYEDAVRVADALGMTYHEAGL